MLQPLAYPRALGALTHQLWTEAAATCAARNARLIVRGDA
jgi:hypothetical protein